ncbi:hypothetical protein F4553_004634 [Allocatelliglobosispora scoriae]|uniref:DUF4878 domain-containing protein n=1 Tax=Allocatelliglobosispora scoriae TaxID=643052 RepID=A0A841BU87_9ACTN|nr:hypothetical protein [Allocatelliglobosispora scoriae]MBB5871255.1 hypothetical protein [Allocatelliglobosispora scoriae]
MADEDRRSSKTRRIIVFVLVATGLVVLGGAGLTFRIYDQATKVDRSQPEVVVREYIVAVLNRRDDAKAAIYSCENSQGLMSILELRSSLESDERKFNLSTQVSLARLSRDGSGRVDADLEILQQGSGGATQDRQHWKFTMVQDDGWRVCGAERLPDPIPTPTPSPSTTQPTAP